MSAFKWRQFTGEVILWAVRWYCRYGISYREFAEMLAERGVEVDHTTLYRWTQRYAPELEHPHRRMPRDFTVRTSSAIRFRKWAARRGYGATSTRPRSRSDPPFPTLKWLRLCTGFLAPLAGLLGRGYSLA